MLLGLTMVVIDDDFADFQAAPVSPAAGSSAQRTTAGANILAATKPMSPPIAAQQPAQNLFNMLGSTTTSPPPMTASRAPSYAAAPLAPTAFSSSVMAPMSTGSRAGSTPGTGPATSPAAKPASSGNFDDLWSMSLGTSVSKPQAQSTQAKSMQDLQKEKSQAGIWATSQQARPPMGSGFGSFNAAPSQPNQASSSGNGLDDLLF